MSAPQKKKYIAEKFDDFSGKRMIVHEGEVSWINRPAKTRLDFELWRIIKDGSDSLCIICTILVEDWIFARNGNLALKIDGDMIELECMEIETDTPSGSSGDVMCLEKVAYAISPDLLKKVCDSQSLRVRLNGGERQETPDESWCDEFRKYCRQFYNGTYDQSLYLDDLEDIKVGGTEPVKEKTDAPKQATISENITKEGEESFFKSVMVRAVLAIAAIFILVKVFG